MRGAGTYQLRHMQKEQVIEKHFTLDKSLEGNDHKVSLTPSEYSQMSQAFVGLSKAFGIGHKDRLPKVRHQIKLH